MTQEILHLNFPQFPVNAERLRNPSLNQHPVMVANLATPRAFVVEASNEARSWGVRPGMSLDVAARHCRDAAILPLNKQLYAQVTDEMVRLLGHYSPIIEPTIYGRIFLDMTGTRRLFGHIKDAGWKAQGEVQEKLGLESAVGLASNKLVSRIASQVVKPKHIQDVQHGDEERFIAPLKLHYLPSARPKVRAELIDLNVRFVKELSRISVEHLTLAFGRVGLRLHRESHAIDNQPVRPPTRRAEISETLMLPEDTNDHEILVAETYRLVERCTLKLRMTQRLARCLEIKIVYSDHREAGGQTSLPSSDSEFALQSLARALLERVLDRRVRVKKITVRFSRLARDSAQLSLLKTKADRRDQALVSALDRIRGRFGMDSIWFAGKKPVDKTPTFSEKVGV